MHGALREQDMETREFDGFPELQRLAAQVRDAGLPPETRCPAVYLLAKRVGPDASELLARCLRGDEQVRTQAVMALAAYGTDVAWDEICADLEVALAVPASLPWALPWNTLVLQSDVVQMACYLGRHLDVPGRRERVTALIRAYWPHRYDAERRWFDEYWPACNPEGSGTGPDPQRLSAYVREPWFDNGPE
jgi:hypothetical protein